MMLILKDWYKITFDGKILFEAHVLDPQIPYAPILITYSSPARSRTKDRQKALPCLGVLLCYHDEEGRMVYNWSFDCDRRLSFMEIYNVDKYLYNRYGYHVCFVMRTAKGMHIYTNIESYNPNKVLKIAYKTAKIFHFDHHQVKLAKIRYQISRQRDLAEFWGVLRLAGKYEKRDIFLYDVLHPECLNPWHKNVLKLLGYVIWR